MVSNSQREEITKRTVTKRQPFDGAKEEGLNIETPVFMSSYGCKMTPSYSANVSLLLPLIPRHILLRNLH